MDTLKLLLQITLSVVNYLNGGTARGQAHGMKLETLAKLGVATCLHLSANSLTGKICRHCQAYTWLRNQGFSYELC
jgi:hypothetical protein